MAAQRPLPFPPSDSPPGAHGEIRLWLPPARVTPSIARPSAQSHPPEAFPFVPEATVPGEGPRPGLQVRFSHQVGLDSPAAQPRARPGDASQGPDEVGPTAGWRSQGCSGRQRGAGMGHVRAENKSSKRGRYLQVAGGGHLRGSGCRGTTRPKSAPGSARAGQTSAPGSQSGEKPGRPPARARSPRRPPGPPWPPRQQRRPRRLRPTPAQRASVGAAAA